MTAVKSPLDTLPLSLRERVERAWQTYYEHARAADIQPVRHPELLRVLRRVWAYSDFVADNCARHPRVLADLLQSGDLFVDYAAGEYVNKLRAALAQVSDEAELSIALRQVRRREMLRIAWRDLAGWADVRETLADASAFAAACIDAALDTLHGWQCAEWGMPRDAEGVPQTLVVLGMGKLGAHELNFSSDVDLIFVYTGDGETRARRRLSNEEYFIRLAQRLIRALDERTPEGFVFRVDARLRPFGESGPLALSFAALEDYYQTHGREWERYAFIKARVVAGDRVAGARLMRSLHPFIYRRYLDFGAFEALRAMKELIARELQRKGMENNIKLGWGGIREVEFIGQVFQLIRGGRDARLQRPELLPVLDALRDAQYLPEYAARELREGYLFLRRVENRLQEVADEQTHTLPTDELGQLRLALSMGYGDWETFERALNKHRARVHGHFEQVFAAPQAESAASPDLDGLWQGALIGAHACEVLNAQGFTDAAEALRWLDQLRAGHSYRALSERGRARLDKLMPLLIAALGRTDRPNAALARLVPLIETIARRTAYLALLIENPMALSQLVKLCAASPWVSAMLARHPLLLDELLDARTLYAVLDKAGLEQELRRVLAPVAEDDLEQHMETLRHFKHVQVLRVAAADIGGALPLMKVSDHLTWLAEVIVQEVLNLAWRHLTAKHGHPSCRIEGKTREPGFAVIGYGKFGGIELGYGSDLDLVFLHSSSGEQQRTTGPRGLDNSVFFARLGQRIIHILNTLTPSGVLYEVDTRLRPSGASGLLVSSLESYADYQRHHAWTWEHQALVRARVVAGAGADAADLAAGFTRLRGEILARPRDAHALRTEVRDMRAKMRTALGGCGAERFDLKQDRGGIADIEFMVQYGVLLWAHAHPELLVYPDNIRLLETLSAAGLLPAQDAQRLSDAYRAYRGAVHRAALQEEPACADVGEFREYRQGVMDIWRKLMGE
ncbi:MAG: bifunctional [glutamate--ammonia ligase]-adenylyl-L-tyrosine phosphorylase/[glutamate--ammonia-ligase] adenylyltransferase [Pseudomonadota bacterium]